MGKSCRLIDVFIFIFILTHAIDDVLFPLPSAKVCESIFLFDDGVSITETRVTVSVKDLFEEGIAFVPILFFRELLFLSLSLFFFGLCGVADIVVGCLGRVGFMSTTRNNPLKVNGFEQVYPFLGHDGGHTRLQPSVLNSLTGNPVGKWLIRVIMKGNVAVSGLVSKG